MRLVGTLQPFAHYSDPPVFCSDSEVMSKQKITGALAPAKGRSKFSVLAGDAVDKPTARTVISLTFILGGRPMVGLQTLDLAIGVRVPASQKF